MGSEHRWTSLTDDEMTENEAAALDAILPVVLDCGAGAATTCGYDKKGWPLGSMTVAFVGEVVIGIAVRNAKDEHAVIVSVMEPADRGPCLCEEGDSMTPWDLPPAHHDCPYHGAAVSSASSTDTEATA